MASPLVPSTHSSPTNLNTQRSSPDIYEDIDGANGASAPDNSFDDVSALQDRDNKQPVLTEIRYPQCFIKVFFRTEIFQYTGNLDGGRVEYTFKPKGLPGMRIEFEVPHLGSLEFAAQFSSSYSALPTENDENEPNWDALVSASSLNNFKRHATGTKSSNVLEGEDHSQNTRKRLRSPERDRRETKQKL